jgi:hypothetical protein
MNYLSAGCTRQIRLGIRIEVKIRIREVTQKSEMHPPGPMRRTDFFGNTMEPASETPTASSIPTRFIDRATKLTPVNPALRITSALWA